MTALREVGEGIEPDLIATIVEPLVRAAFAASGLGQAHIQPGLARSTGSCHLRFVLPVTARAGTGMDREARQTQSRQATASDKPRYRAP